ncbi:MAG: DUF4835 family protein [Bacteroidales bacterium]|nr:DUF4835 family protein [Bacteroidales bacterium]
MIKRVLAILLVLTNLGVLHAQEFRCAVSVNYQKLMSTTQSYESSDKKVFENMKQALEDFINSRRWTNLEMEQNERLDCSLSIILNERTSPTDFKGQVTIQLRRPVYNSNYTTGLFNYIESGNLPFAYNESQPLDYDPNTFYGDLSSVVSYYLYIMLGLYFDSYGMNGGEPFFEMANTICQTASQQRQEPSQGWNSRGSAKARYWFMENHTNSAYAPLHRAYYLYHRMGLDMMTKDQPQARKNIIAALEALQQVNKARPNSLSVQQFVDVKITELVSIFSPAPADEQKQVYDIIKAISPISVSKLKDFAQK